jgi:hypothetical protein
LRPVATCLGDDEHSRTGQPHASLYLVDLPGGSARILSIAIVAPESSFESVVEAAAPILDSFEFHTG